ncbi:MAG TPA: hypothetical protein VNU70_03095, partial [Puia sp.]|nr:hypothetical protein [Puia sp.]
MWRAIICLWILSLLRGAACFGQPSTLPRQDYSIPEVLDKLIERGYQVVYVPDLFRNAPRVAVSPDAPPRELLEKCFAGLKFRMHIEDKTI